MLHLLTPFFVECEKTWCLHETRFSYLTVIAKQAFVVHVKFCINIDHEHTCKFCMK
jgi:hypothetical protein